MKKTILSWIVSLVIGGLVVMFICPSITQAWKSVTGAFFGTTSLKDGGLATLELLAIAFVLIKTFFRKNSDEGGDGGGDGGGGDD